MTAQPNPGAAPKPFAGRKIHFIGAGGCGMSGLAEFVLQEGAEVSGSDLKTSAAVSRLSDLGARIYIGHQVENIPLAVDLVVASAAIKPDNPEMIEALRRNIPVQKYAQFLGALMQLRKGIAIAGAHGKSTTAAMVSYALHCAGKDPSYVIGAEVPQLGGGSHADKGEHLVVEACEFDRSFHNYKPHAAAILNIEEDHLDYYHGGLPEIRQAFAEFAANIVPGGLLVANSADLGVREIADTSHVPVETFGIGGQYDWRAENLEADQGRFTFDVYEKERLFVSVRLAIPGRHNVLNALATMALCHWAGADTDAVTRALGNFSGAARRMQVLGEAAGVTVVDDYAHHPTEICATLKAAKARFNPKRLWVVFQPHQHSRTRFFLKDFGLALAVADKVVVPDIYFVRDSENERQAVRSQDLVAELQRLGADGIYIPEFDSIRRYLVESLGAGDVLMTMGAGDVWHLAEPLLADLGGGAAAGSADGAETPAPAPDGGGDAGPSI
ncbi:MAG: UDP-N-acetylmuramate--L-alanine ligase [Planctomycetota bacterium]|nr:UDP-N-acetylmuramate--L-alanine ligase [Planctomycetota bacterium]